ncbi:dienelactone hydrolase family protein [Peribacillus simplex]|uniref:Dienelactone hydrolase family protein n=2 Tax=Peribacillus TaxID=2675229 RepID=A0AA90SLM4_9BACI|nr:MULTISPECIES: dienelactone hydrolase family protein [Peribacillus]MDP1420534.1 dienelactone hydrolase family protein [Peribacillus simplex]MDP1453341.1 dienelactone hydrolase family protein [Peribacillus frigoritolerans]
MLHIQKDSDTVIIVIHEIYGLNQHMQGFCESLSKQGFDVICPNLLGRKTPFDYSQEEAAYRHFMENVGFTNALHKIKEIGSNIKDEYQKIFILGFSAGATVAWLCSEEEWVDGIVGYYGSRIRNYLELTPQCPALLFFPQEESAFNVDELISALERKNIEVHKFNGKHGFSDPYSSKYHVESAQKAVSKMMKFFMMN